MPQLFQKTRCAEFSGWDLMAFSLPTPAPGEVRGASLALGAQVDSGCTSCAAGSGAVFMSLGEGPPSHPLSFMSRPGQYIPLGAWRDQLVARHMIQRCSFRIRETPKNE